MIARDLQPEVMDQEGLDPAAHRRALAGLARINAWSRSGSLLWPAIRHLARSQRLQTVRILDVASGGGDVSIALWKKARQEGLEAQITGLDISPVAVCYAREKAQSAGAAVRFEEYDVFSRPLTERYHVTTSSLFLHHLSEARAVSLLRQMAAVTEYTLLINDLYRSQLGMAVAHLACRLLTRSRIVHADGPQSVAAAFTVEEMASLFEQANLSSVQIQRHWPFRQLAQWSTHSC